MDVLKDKTLLAEITTAFKPGSTHWVKITHINNPHSFYVRGSKFETLLETIELQIPDSKDVNLRDWVVFNLSSTSDRVRYARGQVLSTYQKQNDTFCDVLAIDSGVVHKNTPLKCILRSNDSIRYIPPLAFHCQLANCEPLGNGEWSEEAIEAMKCYIGNERVKMIVKSKAADKLNVTLVNTCPDDIATLLALTGFSTLGYRPNEISRIPAFVTRRMFFKFKNLIVNDTLHVRMQYGSSLNEFYVAEVGDYKHYIENKDNMSNLAKKQKGLPNEELVENMPVCVINDLRKCERAIVKSFYNSKSEATVQLVDSGKLLRAHVLNMKQIPELWLKDTVIAIYCAPEEHQLSDIRLNRILQPGFEFLITIKQLGHQFQCPNMVTITMID